MRVNSSSTGNQVTGVRQSVYDGRERCGDVQQCDDGFVARDRQGNIIGTFTSLPTAATACWRIAHGQTEGVS